MIILLGIALKYSNLCTFSWFLVKPLLLIKTAQLTVRGSLNRPPPRFSLQEQPRAPFIPGSHDVPVDESSPGLLPYLCLLETDQALKVAALTPSSLFKPALQAQKGKGGRERDLLSLSLLRVSPPPPPSPFACFAPAAQLLKPLLKN